MSLLESDSYFSITDILVSEERIQCEIQQILPNLGFLSPAAKDGDLKPGQKLDLPLWLASALSTKREVFVACETPKIYRDSYREILQADACAVELNKLNHHYYELGLQLPQLSEDERRKLPEFLLDVFKSRFRIIMDSEQNPFSVVTMRGQLSVLERKLLGQGTIGRQQLLNWLNKGVKNIKTSNVLSNIRKRKRMEI